MHLIIKEKMIALGADKFEEFKIKWENFTEFYDFFGPDCQVIV